MIPWGGAGRHDGDGKREDEDERVRGDEPEVASGGEEAEMAAGGAEEEDGEARLGRGEGARVQEEASS